MVMLFTFKGKANEQKNTKKNMIWICIWKGKIKDLLSQSKINITGSKKKREDKQTKNHNKLAESVVYKKKICVIFFFQRDREREREGLKPLLHHQFTSAVSP